MSDNPVYDYYYHLHLAVAAALSDRLLNTNISLEGDNA